MFYDEFLSACPAAKPYFDGLDLKVQARVLIASLQMVVACKLHNYPAALSYLTLLGNRHHRRNIPHELYPPFRDAMLLTLAKHHGDGWDEQLRAEWHDAFNVAIEAMLDGYRAQHLTY